MTEVSQEHIIVFVVLGFIVLGIPVLGLLYAAWTFLSAWILQAIRR